MDGIVRASSCDFWGERPGGGGYGIVTVHRYAEATFQRLLEFAPDAILGVRTDGRIVLVSAQTERLFGYSRDELLGQQVEMLVPQRVRRAHVAHRAGYIANPVTRPMGADQELVARRKDGSEFPAEISLSAIETGDGLLVSAAVRDVTHRRRAEAALREREATLAAVFSASPDLIALVDKDGRIRLMSPAIQRILGRKAEELDSEGLDFSLLHPDDREPYTQALLHVLAGHDDHGAVRVRVRHADGHWVVLESYPRPLDDGILVVSRDVTGQVALEEDLRQAKLAAEQANQAKSDYLSRMSHELRTPLNAVLGFAQLLDMDELHGEQRDSLGHILSAAQHLLALIDEVLDIAAIEAGRLPLSLEPVAVTDPLGESLDLIRPLADQHGVQLHDSPAAPCTAFVHADRQRLEQILFNLLSNAVKYNRRGGSVRLTCEQVAGERLRVTVTDTGPGIAPAVLDRLFVPFERLGSERTTVEGSGLGLPVSKRLAEAMGGTLSMSTDVGRGSSFWVELPLAAAPAKGAEQLMNADRPPGQDQNAAAGPSLRVLYIEDNLSNLQLVERILARRPGVELIPAMRPGLGLELANEHHPDLVLLDLHLPDMPGEEVFKRLRAEPRTAAIPVVVLSADARPGLITRMLDEGVRAFLTKPLQVSKLLALLDAIVTERAG